MLAHVSGRYHTLRTLSRRAPGVSLSSSLSCHVGSTMMRSRSGEMSACIVDAHVEHKRIIKNQHEPAMPGNACMLDRPTVAFSIGAEVPYIARMILVRADLAPHDPGSHAPAPSSRALMLTIRSTIRLRSWSTTPTTN